MTALRQRPYQVQLTPDAPTSESIRTRYAVSPSRAPAGRHTAWAYCHVPNGSEKDCTELIERQIARFAPDFRDCILARSISAPAALERWNQNLVGGDFLGGAMDIGQLLLRPAPSLYRTPRSNLYLCGASTPPGGGVHGMCGYHAAKTALRAFDSFGCNW